MYRLPLHDVAVEPDYHINASSTIKNSRLLWTRWQAMTYNEERWDTYTPHGMVAIPELKKPLDTTPKIA